METPLLAAALIVKNEERFLPDCLASLNALRPVLSEICVYDTGSVDRTIEIAETAGARVKRGYWDDDFARAKNDAIAMTSSKWVLVVDADERIDADAPALDRVLRRALTENMVGMDAILVQLHNLDHSDREIAGFMVPRIHRPSRAQYVNKIHEELRPLRGDSLAAADPGKSVVRIRHLGYADRSKMAGKGGRNTRIAAEVTAAARSNKALIDHARSLYVAGDIEAAVAKLWEVRRSGVMDVSRRWAGEWLAGILTDFGRYEDSAAIVREVRIEGSDQQYCDLLMCANRLGQERWSEALELIRTVNVPINSGGMLVDPAECVEKYMIAAARCRELDEALACAVKLMAGYGRLDGYGGLLLALWGDRPMASLADLLAATSAQHLPRLAEELRGHGVRGSELADRLTVLQSEMRGDTGIFAADCERSHSR